MNNQSSNAQINPALDVIGSIKSLVIFFLPLYLLAAGLTMFTTLNINSINLEAEDALVYESITDMLECDSRCVYGEQEIQHLENFVKRRADSLKGKYSSVSLLSYDANQLTEDYRERLNHELTVLDMSYKKMTLTDEEKKEWEESKKELRSNFDGIEQSFVDLGRSLFMLAFPWPLILWALFYVPASVARRRLSRG